MQSKERPMLYSTDMVVSILEDRKTKTRRLNGLEEINENPDMWKLDSLGPMDWETHDGKPHPDNKAVYEAIFLSAEEREYRDIKCPYGQPGDLLWVRESFSPVLDHWDENGFFVASDKVAFKADFKEPVAWNWKPSIHMPKVAARIWLEITDIRVERLNTISKRDAIAEGIERRFDGLFHEERYKDYFTNADECIFFADGRRWKGEWRDPISSFGSLWMSINGTQSWFSNPWVWVISFKVLSKTGKTEQIPSGFETQESLKSSLSGTMQEQVEEAHLLPGNGEGKEVANG